jgi:diaminobutyrate-2-oxoglutarate transaminase
MSSDINQTSVEPAAGVFESLESSVRSYSRSFPKVFDRARDSYLYARDGKRYLDFLTGCSSLNYGHNHPVLTKALIEYIEGDGIAHGLDLFTDAKEQLLTELSRSILKPRGLDYVVQFPGPTGANAVEAALKLARKVTGREQVIAFTNAFHGVTLGALACTGNRHHRGGAGTQLAGVSRLPYDGYLGTSVDTADLLERMLSDPSSGIDEPAAIILETVQGEGGLHAASDDWLRRVADISRKHGALLIVDDIQAGVGRTGTFFSFESSGIRPDIVTLAKSISGSGLPMSLVLIDREHDEWAPGEHNGTFRGNCHAFVTATEALRHFWRDEQFEQSIRDKAAIVDDRFAVIVERYGAAGLSARGRGMMRGLEMPNGRVAANVVKYAFSEGLIVETSGPDDEVVKCLAALTIDNATLSQGLDILENAVTRAMRQEDRAAA